MRIDTREKGKDNILPRKPAPELERLLADAPSAREVCELAHVAVLVRKRERVLVVVQVELHDLSACAETSIVCAKRTRARERTLILMQSASTFASAHRFVRGGNMAVEPNMIIRVAYASW